MTGPRAAACAATAVAALAGCSGGDDSSESPRATVERYFAAVGDGRADRACAELSERSRERIAEFAKPLRADGEGCAAVMRVVLTSRFGANLRRLSDARIERLDVKGSSASVHVDGVGRPVELVRENGTWRIEFTPSVEADRLPGGPKEEGEAAEGGR